MQTLISVGSLHLFNMFEVHWPKRVHLRIVYLEKWLGDSMFSLVFFLLLGLDQQCKVTVQGMFCSSYFPLLFTHP